MQIEEIVAGLLELAEERKTWFRADGDDEIFRRDYAVLTAAAEEIQNLRAELRAARSGPRKSACEP